MTGIGLGVIGIWAGTAVICWIARKQVHPVFYVVMAVIAAFASAGLADALT